MFGAAASDLAAAAASVVRRAQSFDRKMGKLAMPTTVEENPQQYAQYMRLLWLAASMKSFDVLVLLLPLPWFSR